MVRAPMWLASSTSACSSSSIASRRWPRANALADEEVDEGVEDVGEGEDHPHQRAHADQLGHELARVAVEKPRDRAVHPVPAPAVVAGAVREEADAEHAPEATGPVHGGR